MWRGFVAVVEHHLDVRLGLDAAQRGQFGLVQGQFQITMGAKERHQIHHIHIEIAVGDLVDGIKVALHHDGEVAAAAFLLEEFLGDVGDQVVVGVDMHHDAFDGIVACHGTEGTARVQALAGCADVRQRLAVGDHHRHLGETVARGEGEEVGVLHHVDTHGLVELTVEDVAEDAVVGGDEILPLGLHDHMRVLDRLNGIHRDDVYCTRRETAETGRKPLTA